MVLYSAYISAHYIYTHPVFLLQRHYVIVTEALRIDVHNTHTIVSNPWLITLQYSPLWVNSCENGRFRFFCNWLVFSRNHSNITSLKFFYQMRDWVWVMMFNTTFNNISAILCGQFYWWRKPKYQRKHWPATSHWQTLSHNVGLCIPRHERD